MTQKFDLDYKNQMVQKAPVIDAGIVKKSETQSKKEDKTFIVAEEGSSNSKSIHFNTNTLEEAAYFLEAYRQENALIVAGGLDVVRELKIKYLLNTPHALINLKKIPGLTYIKQDTNQVKIGALTRASQIAQSKIIQEKYPVLAQAAALMGTPQIRNMATLSGSICQEINCWYYKAANNQFNCIRKGGDICHAVEGANKWMFSIIESKSCKGCHATCQSDLSIALTALDAVIVTTQREIPISEFYSANFPSGNVLHVGEIITEIVLPSQSAQTRSIYMKYALRKSFDHPLISAACLKDEHGIKIVLGGVAMVPYVVNGVNEIIKGQEITEELAIAVGEFSVRGAKPLSENTWKVPVVSAYVKRALMALG